MATVRTFKQSFSGGEISPEMFGRIDDAKYQNGLALARNFIIEPQGPAQNRAGFRLVRATKYSNKKTRLIPFTYSTTQTMVIEMGEGYFRFHTQGATLLSGASPYEVANPYAEADLFDIHFVQSADVLTLVHPKYQPRELRRYSATDWRLTAISLAAPIAAPGAPTVTSAGFTTAKYTYKYVVTAVASDGVSESAASSSGSVSSNLFETGCTNTISWSAVSGATLYNVYKYQGGLYGYVGQTATVSLVDDNISPDMSKTPPNYDDPFSKTGAIISVPVATGGSGYSISYTGGGFVSVSVEDVPETSFEQGTQVTVSDPTGTGATFSVTINPASSWDAGEYGSGVIPASITVTVLTAGSGYTSPSLTLRDSAGNVIANNLRYTLAPLVYNGPSLSVTDTTGKGAVLQPVVSGGAIVSVTVVEGGTGYTAPTITLSTNNGGTGATFGAAVLNSTGDYPAAVTYFEQRRVFGGTNYRPQNVWMTRAGTETTMSYSLPIRDDDRVAFRIYAREANTIRHLVPLSQMLVLTSSTEWRVTSVNSDAITPSNVQVRPQSYVGASSAQPQVINNSVLYAAARGGHLQELGYSWQLNGYTTGDLCIRSAHLFDGYDLIDLAYAKAPIPVLWATSTSGKLLSLTYLPEQQIGAWAQHDTDGRFLSCAVVAEGSEDVLYVVTGRTINGSYVQFIEQQATRRFLDQNDAFFVDCGLTYSGTATTAISGLSHLEGKTVAILADGAVHPPRTVVSGAVTLDNAASKVHIGLPITADLQTLPIAAQIDGAFGQGRLKNVNKVWLRVFKSSGIFVGPNPANLTEIKQRTVENYGTPPALKTQELSVMTTPAWQDGGQVLVRQTDPLPLTVVSLTAEVALGN